MMKWDEVLPELHSGLPEKNKLDRLTIAHGIFYLSRAL
jgi:hypothetical protein